MTVDESESIIEKILIDTKVIEQIQEFNYLGYRISYVNKNDMYDTLQGFQYICRSIQRISKTGNKATMLKLYKITGLYKRKIKEQ
jgi:hypothetical protein